MKRAHAFLLLGGLMLASLRAEENIGASLEKAVLVYTERLAAANAELTATRERINLEKAPLLASQQAAEQRLLAAEMSVTRLETFSRRAADNRHRLVKEAETLHRNGSYLVSLAQDGLKAYGENWVPGEEQLHAARWEELSAAFNDPARAAGGQASIEAAGFLLERVRQSLGGYTAPGRATVDEGNEVHDGTYAFVGPQSLFQAADGSEGGVAVRLRSTARHPVAFPIKDWPAAGRAALFRGEEGAFPADATGTKALQLEQTTGTITDHIKKGGYVAYAILAVGFIALLLIVMKLMDVSRLAVEDPVKTQAFLTRVEQGDLAQARASLASLKVSTREVFATGLDHLHLPKVALEEHLQALLLRQRLYFERRLPLLAVIATAAPLMGLLGTVVGMIKTFALITVFGTGNAGRLAGGISEVLVATELGLAVAIPALVVHGFLSQRIHKDLAALERAALQFVTAATSRRPEGGSA